MSIKARKSNNELVFYRIEVEKRVLLWGSQCIGRHIDVGRLETISKKSLRVLGLKSEDIENIKIGNDHYLVRKSDLELLCLRVGLDLNVKQSLGFDYDILKVFKRIKNNQPLDQKIKQIGLIAQKQIEIFEKINEDINTILKGPIKAFVTSVEGTDSEKLKKAIFKLEDSLKFNTLKKFFINIFRFIIGAYSKDSENLYAAKSLLNRFTVIQKEEFDEINFKEDVFLDTKEIVEKQGERDSEVRNVEVKETLMKENPEIQVEEVISKKSLNPQQSPDRTEQQKRSVVVRASSLNPIVRPLSGSTDQLKKIESQSLQRSFSDSSIEKGQQKKDQENLIALKEAVRDLKQHIAKVKIINGKIKTADPKDFPELKRINKLNRLKIKELESKLQELTKVLVLNKRIKIAQLDKLIEANKQLSSVPKSHIVRLRIKRQKVNDDFKEVDDLLAGIPKKIPKNKDKKTI